MVVYEDNGKLNFSQQGQAMTTEEGFAYLDSIYPNEVAEVKRAIDKLREKYAWPRSKKRSLLDEVE